MIDGFNIQRFFDGNLLKKTTVIEFGPGGIVSKELIEDLLAIYGPNSKHEDTRGGLQVTLDGNNLTLDDIEKTLLYRLTIDKISGLHEIKLVQGKMKQ